MQFMLRLLNLHEYLLPTSAAWIGCTPTFIMSSKLMHLILEHEHQSFLYLIGTYLQKFVLSILHCLFKNLLVGFNRVGALQDRSMEKATGGPILT